MRELLLSGVATFSRANFEKLFAYSADMLGSSQTCKLLLAAWLCHLQESSWAAIDKNGEVVGYLIMSETICFPKEGYLIAPLYANSAAIARSLLKVAAEFASANDPRHKLRMTMPVNLNPEGVAFWRRKLEPGVPAALYFMADKENPNKYLSKVLCKMATFGKVFSKMLICCALTVLCKQYR